MRQVVLRFGMDLPLSLPAIAYAARRARHREAMAMAIMAVNHLNSSDLEEAFSDTEAAIAHRSGMAAPHPCRSFRSRPILVT